MATTTDKQWISCTDTARLIRAQLKRRFAGVTFSVRSSHGTSVDIKWTDGPTKSAWARGRRFISMATSIRPAL